jgi:hypothetical protein
MRFLRSLQRYFTALAFIGCSGVPSTVPSTEPTTTPQSQESPLPPPKFAVVQGAFGSVRLGMTHDDLVRSLPLDLRLVAGGVLPPGLAGQVYTITDETDLPLFLAGVVDGQIAWLLAESAAASVGTELGVGFGSSLSLARQKLGKEAPLPLPDDTTEWVEFTDNLSTVRFSFGAKPVESSKLEKILLARESLLPNATVSLRGIVLPDARVAFLEGNQRHETEVSTAASLPVVGALVEGEGTRQTSGAIRLTRQFAVNPSAKEVAASLQDRVRTDADFLAYASLLSNRHSVTEYHVEALPDAAGVVSALVIFTGPEGEGYCVIRLPSPDGALEIRPAVFGVEKATYLGNL